MSQQDIDYFTRINEEADSEHDRGVAAERLLLTSNQSPQTYEEFLELVFHFLNIFTEDLENEAEFYTDQSEDAITNYLAAMFRATGVFTASGQTYAGGAVDLTISANSHTWRAEAKIAYSNDKIFEGLIQILTRYANRDSNKGLLVYVNAGTFLDKLNNWRTYIGLNGGWASYASRKQTEHTDAINAILNTANLSQIENYNNFDCQFLLPTGRPVTIKNYFINLKFSPSDTSGNSAKKHRENLAINELKCAYHEYLENQPEDLDTDKILRLLEMLARD
ncbi:hypothetical protein [Aliivibrio fischeri]|uniref:hypothetical protein n=1 Tax=Aliivibrio fischeri TaxID=668 RepID=UPI001F193575|nr:hypothetical protein [Aliivibrio fischeri]MCE7534835.1 hypothetical protein [Aliivibrio fischeri]MCE7557329.1 hypothetical protein [Aliivibrio fischeri]